VRKISVRRLKSSSPEAESVEILAFWPRCAARNLPTLESKVRHPEPAGHPEPGALTPVAVD